MATVPDSLVWEIVRKNNSFLIKQFGNGDAKVQFSKEPNNLYNVHSYKHSGLCLFTSLFIWPFYAIGGTGWLFFRPCQQEDRDSVASQWEGGCGGPLDNQNKEAEQARQPPPQVCHAQGVPQDGQGCQEPGIEQPHPMFNLLCNLCPLM